MKDQIEKVKSLKAQIEQVNDRCDTAYARSNEADFEEAMDEGFKLYVELTEAMAVSTEALLRDSK